MDDLIHVRSVDDVNGSVPWQIPVMCGADGVTLVCQVYYPDHALREKALGLNYEKSVTCPTCVLLLFAHKANQAPNQTEK